jgi:Na+/proline symporter
VKLHPLDLLLVLGYLVLVAVLGFLIKKWATRRLESYYLADRNVPWWMLGLSGCSSYIDIGGTMSMVGLMFYVGLKSAWATHLFWGWFIICFYMAFQAKWIRRSGVMTFAEWNRTRYGEGRDAEAARVAAALFLLALMVCNLAFIAVGIGKFAEEFLPLARWQSTLMVFTAVGLYVTLGGFFGVILTDMLQTLLIAAGAVILTVLAFQQGSPAAILAEQPGSWGALAPTWTLWEGYAESTPKAYAHFASFGPLLLAGSFWMIFRVLAGPNVWDFQFFLTARSPRDAALAGGLWTVGYTLRWILGSAFLVLGFHYLGTSMAGDAEKIMPQVLQALPLGVTGLFVAVLLAALMSTLDAMINVTSSVVVNDFLKRFFARHLSERALVRGGQVASVVALTLGFVLSLSIQNVIQIWEAMIHVVVTMVLVPATFRWHWWRFSARAFVAGMVGSTVLLALRVIFFGDLPPQASLLLDTANCLVVTFAASWLTRPASMDVLVSFYANVRPFGLWGPVRREAVRRGLVAADDREPLFDLANGLLTAVLQFSLCLIPFYAMLRQWSQALIWLGVAGALGIVLYFTWYRQLPPFDGGKGAERAAVDQPS